MIQPPDRRAHPRHSVDERVTVSCSDGPGLTVANGTVVDSSPGGLAIVLARPLDLDLDVDVVVSRRFGSVRHLVVRGIALDGDTLRVAFLDPPWVDPADWQR